jgi:hypothetical protein
MFLTIHSLSSPQNIHTILLYLHSLIFSSPTTLQFIRTKFNWVVGLSSKQIALHSWEQSSSTRNALAGVESSRRFEIEDIRDGLDEARYSWSTPNQFNIDMWYSYLFEYISDLFKEIGYLLKNWLWNLFKLISSHCIGQISLFQQTVYIEIVFANAG